MHESRKAIGPTGRNYRRETMRLSGKVILVAGGGGIGFGLARHFAREGARVVLGDLEEDAAGEVVKAIGGEGGEASAVRLDGTDETSIAAALAHCIETYNGLDGVHANFVSFADNNDDDGVIELPLAAYDETMRVNARGFLLCTRLAVPHLIARGGGSVLYTSSAGAYTGGRSRVAYAMAKSAIHALMRHVATRYGPDGVRANCIAPGSVMHEKWEDELSPAFKGWPLSRTPIKSRLGRPADIASLAALLMSDEGSYITGQVLSVDGGLTMRP
jgi:NAD(P)-dependent dehydrogenase (short-subunit alcohol dehydrogenase family)